MQWTLLGLILLFLLAFLVTLSLGILHLVLWYQQPILIGNSDTTAKSLGFLMISGFFFGASLLSLIIDSLLLWGYLHSRKSQKRKN